MAVLEKRPAAVKKPARVVIDDDAGSLVRQLDQRQATPASIPSPAGACSDATAVGATSVTTHPDLIFFNALGGFTPDGRVYVIE